MTVSLSPAVRHFTGAETSNQYKPQVSHKFFGSGYGGQASHDCPWSGLSMTGNKKPFEQRAILMPMTGFF
jgi:hypothetical protein